MMKIDIIADITLSENPTSNMTTAIDDIQTRILWTRTDDDSFYSTQSTFITSYAKSWSSGATILFQPDPPVSQTTPVQTNLMERTVTSTVESLINAVTDHENSTSIVSNTTNRANWSGMDKVHAALRWIFTLDSSIGWLIGGTAYMSGVVLDLILVIMVVCSLSCVRRSGHFEV